MVVKLHCSVVPALIQLLEHSVPLITQKMLELSAFVSHVFHNSYIMIAVYFIQQFILYDLGMAPRPLVV